MRQGQHSKKNRGRNRRQSNPGNRVFESNGPDVKIRGNASHVSEKYLALARDAQAVGDPIASENYLQHAEHYLRIIAASQAQQQSQTQPCMPDQADKPAEGARADGQPQSRGRGRSNGDARSAQDETAQTSDDTSEDETAEVNGTGPELSNEDGGNDEAVARNGADQVNGGDSGVAKSSSDDPDAEATEEPAPEAG
jgi:hypothetical protein